MILKPNKITGKLESTCHSVFFSDRHPKDDVDYYNPDSPISFYKNILQDTFFMERLHGDLNTTPEPYCMSETQIVQVYKDVNRVPILRRMKQKFWEEYRFIATSPAQHRGMNPDALFSEITTAWKVILKKPSQLAYICVEPESLIDKASFILDSGYSYLSSLLELPDVENTGRVNTEVIKVKLKVLDMVDKRLNGQYRQSINLKTSHTADPFTQLSVADQVKILEQEVQKSGLLTHDTDN